MMMPPEDPADLELSAEVMRTMGEAALSRLVDHIASLADQPACGDTAAEELCRTMREPAPEHGVPLDDLLGPLFEKWVPRSFNTAGPGYLAYIPGGGIFPAALADLIADGTNRFTGIWRAAPALVQLEANVLDWFRDWMGFPPTTRGLFTTGGSMSIFNAIVCARERHLGTEIRSGTLYASAHAHGSVAKSARLAGILPDRVRAVSVDEQFRMRADALGEVIDADRRAGLRPFMVVSTAGTTNTGAVDPLDVIADLCAGAGLWHHVDGAYGAFFHLVESLGPLLRAGWLSSRLSGSRSTRTRACFYLMAPGRFWCATGHSCARCMESAPVICHPLRTLSSTTRPSTARSYHEDFRACGSG